LGTSKYIDDTVTSSVVRVANNVRATAIVALTTSGRTARLISRFKPYHIIYAITHDSLRQQQLLLSFGVEPLLEKTSHTIDKLVTDVKSIIRTKKIARKNDRVVVSAGMPFGQKGSTNMLVVVDI
jgi:pyruvate kinase